MKRIEVKCWEVTSPDGGGIHSEHVAYTSTEAVALSLVNESKGWPRYANKFEKTFLIVESVEDYKNLITEKKRQRALDKLSEEDKIVLGLK